jgi:hypothetical protein
MPATTGGATPRRILFERVMLDPGRASALTEDAQSSGVEDLRQGDPYQSADPIAHDFSRVPAHTDPDRDLQSFHGGEPLSTRDRIGVESRLGTRVGDVRVHRGPLADRMTAAMRVPAFTVGRNVVLDGTIDTSTRRGAHLLAHEAAHTLQQSRGWPSSGRLDRTSPDSVEERQAEASARGLARPTPGAPLAIAAAPSAAPALTPSRPFKAIWPEFEKAQYGVDRKLMAVLARELASAPFDFDDLVAHGIELVNFLASNGEPQLAQQVLQNVRDAWTMRSVTRGVSLPQLATFGTSGDAGQLIALGKTAARAGKHAEAFQFFGVASEILSFYAMELTEKRTTVLQAESTADEQMREETKNDPARRAHMQSAVWLPRHIARSNQYSTLQGLYDLMREIYGFYFVLEQEARTAGDAKAEATARTKAGELQKEIKTKFTWGGAQQPGSMSQRIDNPVEIAEVSYADTRKGPGLTLHGANSAETDLTQLPGLPSPKEVGSNVQVQNLGAMQAALMAQSDFQAEIGRQPAIRKAFGNAAIDMNDTKTRQKVWLLMYGVFKQSGSGALGALMALIGRYLEAFTIHTQYNVRDWGKSYLDSDMPTDLAGRAERDCGVYALTVAWDVYQTVKRGDATLDVSFELVTMLEHVTLVIRDNSAGEHYVVNNNQVSKAQKGDPLTQVAPQYGAIRGLAHTVGPAVTVGLGSTKDPQKKFHDDAWTRYLAAVDWGLKVDIPADVEALRKTDPALHAQKVLELQEARYKTFYRDQEVFDKGAKDLGPLINGLAAVAGDPKKLAPALDVVLGKAAPLAGIFIRLGPRAGIAAGSKASLAVMPAQAQFLFTLEQGQTVHPLARVALGILHLQAVGGTLTALHTDYLKFCQAIPMFKEQMDAYSKAGAMGRF